MEELFDDEQLSFEFERKFFVRELPSDVREHGSVETIVQAYLFAQDGYAVRVRLIFPDMEASFEPFDEAVDYCGAYERRVLDVLMRQAGEQVRAVISVKSPMVTAERYEFERE
ncbi:MAG: adenylate cyclase, partial [Actinomycetaceae bacterium]|nr:adenylate cyclase [Actinomycetaceae bacterium]